MQLNFFSAWSIRIWEIQFGCIVSNKTGFGESICISIWPSPVVFLQGKAIPLLHEYPK